MRPSAPWSDRLCDGSVAVFGLWTVCCHTVVASGGGLHRLLAVAAVVGVAALALWRGLRGRAAEAEPVEPAEPEPRGRAFARLQIAGLACGIAAIGGASLWNEGPFGLWWSTVAVLGAAALFFLLLEPPLARAPVRGRGPEAALWAVAALCVLVALVTHRPDLDDSFYVNVAVSAADRPGEPLFAGDTMLGLEGLPLHMPAHRVHSYELWNGALSYLTGIPAIYCFHVISALVAAMLLACAHAKLFRLLVPRVWPWALFTLVVVLVAVGETHRWYGNFGLVRMWQGKAIYLFVFMPLVYAYAIGFALSPSVTRWLFLALAQAAALGCSSTAIWAAPAGAWIAMASVLRPSPRGLATLALGALSSLYVLGVGLGLRGEIQDLVAPMLKTYAPGAQLASALEQALGEGLLAVFALVSLATAWACCPRGLGQRFAIAAPLAVALVLLNPYWDGWVAANLTGPSYWRSMWSLPVPILLTLVLIAPLHLVRGGGGAIAARAVAMAGPDRLRVLRTALRGAVGTQHRSRRRGPPLRPARAQGAGGGLPLGPGAERGGAARVDRAVAGEGQRVDPDLARSRVSRAVAADLPDPAPGEPRRGRRPRAKAAHRLRERLRGLGGPDRALPRGAAEARRAGRAPREHGPRRRGAARAARRGLRAPAPAHDREIWVKNGAAGAPESGAPAGG